MQKKIFNLLRLRREIDRKILLNESWSVLSILKYKIKLLLETKKIKSLFILKDSFYYHFLNKEVKKTADKNQILIDINGIKIESIERLEKYPPWFSTLKNFDIELRNENAFLVIQGSYADNRITNYSDIDLVIFYEPYNEKVLLIKKRIEVFLLAVDTLQHHGVFMIDRNTFDYYWQMDLPVEVLQEAKVFTSVSQTLPITQRIDENYSSIATTFMTLGVIEKFLNTDFKTIGLWRWKFFLSQLMLLPTLVLASQGKYVYKKNSFKLVKNMYSKEAWYCIEKATNIRMNWPDPVNFKIYSEMRNDVTENILNEKIIATAFDEISVLEDNKFHISLKAIVLETKTILEVNH